LKAPKLTISLTLDKNLLHEIEDLRGREKRSTFIEHLIRMGLETQKGSGNPSDRKNPVLLTEPAETV
jgi:metal-responsive CopG/Arc/MetJ family transcriptional regulator